MRRRHFEQLKPICPRCKAERKILASLALERVAHEQGEHVIEGILLCTNESCRLEYPIVDGIPIIVPNIRKYIADNIFHINARDDLSPLIESVLGDAVGPGLPFNVARHHSSVYGWGHYGDRAPPQTVANASTASGGSVADCLHAGLGLLERAVESPLLDIGCAAGRSSFELAKVSTGLTLGIDMNFSLLRLAQCVLRFGVARFPLKRVGIVYERLEFEAHFSGSEQVDFWACDALALPFRDGLFRFASALNVFDVVPAPRDLLTAIDRALLVNGQAVVATPYDWSSSTPVEAWVGGVSQRTPHGGAAEPLLRNMLTPGSTEQVGSLSLVGEIEDQPWNIRIHNRHSASYVSHTVACQKAAK